MRQSGFTLVELVVTVMIVAIVSAFAIPGMQGVIENGRLTSDINAFTTTLQYARSEAVKRGVPVGVCAGTSAACVDGDYARGWISFVDGDSSGALNGGEEVLSVEQGLNPDITLNDSGFNGAVVFMPDGTTRGGESGYFILCADNDLTLSRAVTVSVMGRVNQAQDSDKNKIPEDASGNEIGGCA